MKPLRTYKITNAAGEKIRFSPGKVAKSLRKSGVNKEVTKEVVDKIKGDIYDGITTREIHNRTFQILKQGNELLASKYKLKRAIYELGPTGYPFEKFVAAILRNNNYKVDLGKICQGKCVSHEVDILAEKDGKTILIECKFHSEQGRQCNVKIPLYIHARFDDLNNLRDPAFSEGWVVTNTRFTKDAIDYATCVGLKLLSWDFPRDTGLKDLIDHAGLYPITVSSILSKREKEFLLFKDVVLCKEILQKDFYLDHLKVSQLRKNRILREMRGLCSIT